MINKSFCMSSYLALKYIYGNEYDFNGRKTHKNYTLPSEEDHIIVNNAFAIDNAIKQQVAPFYNKKIAVFLSGGMDSAIVASYFPGADAYTFRFNGVDYPSDELHRAEKFANFYGMKLHYVDITWDSMIASLDDLMIAKASPVYYVEPQLFQAAIQAKQDGAEIVMVGEGSDLVFGGLGWLLSKDWITEEFKKIYISIEPEIVLSDPQSMDQIFNQYDLPEGKFDYLRFLEEVFSIEAYTAYDNAFSVAGIPYFDPFKKLKMGEALDLNRIRNGEPKYLVRNLFRMKYPDLPLPEKIRLPNPLDVYMKNWAGPVRNEFRKDIDITKMRGKNKWQIYCLERFLNLTEA